VSTSCSLAPAISGRPVRDGKRQPVAPAVVLPGTSLDAAYVVADRVRSAFADSRRKVDGAELYSTVSAGVAAAKLTANFSAVLENADQALYRAKNRGRNQVERLDSDRQEETNVIRVA
jgi:CRISPR/Cas system-associated protein Cas10 (large subunit of type III CRISPR-Cas system)